MRMGSSISLGSLYDRFQQLEDPLKAKKETIQSGNAIGAHLL